MSEATSTLEPETQTSSNNVLSKLYEGIFLLILLFVFLWNWDGFWQTDISWLNKAQKSFFPSKFTEEQLKVSRVADNTEIFQQIAQRLAEIESENQKLYDEKLQAERNLDQVLSKENQKCRYYDTSLRMFDIMAKKYSDDELRRVLSCTSAECEHILLNRHLAKSICS